MIRDLIIDDLPAVFLIEQQTPSPWTKGQLEGEVFQPCGWGLVGCMVPEGPVLAFLLGRRIVDEAEILKLAVHQEYRRRGLATALLSHAITRFTDDQVCRWYLEVRAENTVARLLYEKFDFHVTHVRRSYYTDPEDDALCLSLTLCS
ncbi:MAG: ribosomal protein S18-alanine N-acetyltransferase [Proteobacteria bacterium]|nr:ribosomal protein S18-alanine N-acetyltransferase [Pseudomonadota bacterium]MBU1685765.1 ribosomal protein S18-alanine N-acetyltransferase [Pseudomonadota bacterium]